MVLVDGQAGIPSASTEPRDIAEAGRSPGYGLTVSGYGLVPYVDPAFSVSEATGPVELVVQAS